MNLKREDNMDNLKQIERKREYKREQLISKILDKDKKIEELQNEKKKKKEYLQSLNKKNIVKKVKLFKKLRFDIKSGKYRNSNELLEHIFHDNSNDKYNIDKYINKTDDNIW